MTYLEFAKKISTMTPEQQNADITVFDTENEEYFRISSLEFSDEDNDVLDNSHPFLAMLV